MKRAFSTVACMKCSWKEIADYASRTGMDAIEIRLHDNGSIFGLQEQELPELLKYFDDRNLVISNLGTSVSLFDYEPKKMKNAENAVRLAARVKAKGIRVFLTPFIKRYSESAHYCYEGIVHALKELCTYALEYHVEIWVETHNEFSTGESLNKLLKDVDFDNLKVIWDIIHPIEKGELPADTLRYLGNRIAHVHIKDGKKPKDSDIIDYVYTKLGDGELPIGEIVKLLENAGYDGCLSLEWETAWRAELSGIYDSLMDLLEDFNSYIDRVNEKAIYTHALKTAKTT